ncbi:MAG: ECF transporter S component [Nitrososphaeria archaeon]
MNHANIRRLNSREISIAVVLAALGAVGSVTLGYAGRLLSSIPLLSPILSQALSGLHVFWVILAFLLAQKEGISTLTGILKGMVEAFLSSHLGLLVVLISAIEGLSVDIIFYMTGRRSPYSVYLAGGISSASNMIVLTLVLDLYPIVFIIMFLSSFLSGLLFGGYLGQRVYRALPKTVRISEVTA